MSIVMIGDWGKNKEGVHTYSINATTKDELYKIIGDLRNAGWKLWDTPNFTCKAKTWHILLQIYDPKELGYPEESNG